MERSCHFMIPGLSPPDFSAIKIDEDIEQPEEDRQRN